MPNKKKVVITQSNYIPWKGYFDALRLADEFVLYDDVQYTKRDWRNRNKIKTPQGIQWLTIPVEVKGKFFQSIKDTKISDSKWNKKHWRAICLNYSKAPFFHQYKDYFEELYLNCNEKFISMINFRFLTGINNILQIHTPIRFSSEFKLIEGKNERLVDLCLQLKATDYYTGPLAKSYIDETVFMRAGITVNYLDYTGYPEYPQLYPPFTHYVTILDLLFNVGDDFRKYMKF